MPASTRAPGSETSPPATSTRPRASLSSSPRGSGSGQRLRRERVMAVPRAPGARLLRGDFGIGLGRDRSSGLLERSDEVEEVEPKLSAGCGSFVVDVRCHRAVRDFVLAIDPENLLLGHVLDEISHAEDDDRVADEQHPLAAVLARDHLDRAAKTEDDVAPALAAGGPMVKFAEQLAKPGLVGMICFDSDLGQAVENSKFLFAKPLVDDDGEAVP